MNEKELLGQLNNLKNIKPDNNWKQESRDVLLSQISAGDYAGEEIVKLNFSYYFRNFFHQPALVVSAILLIVLGGGIFSVGASRDAKPGDSLYIAKIISEKAQLAITFNEKNKAKLGIEFAGNRAKEIAQVLAGEGNGDKDVKVEKLAHNFKKEISAAKTRLKNIKVIQNDNNVESGDEAGQEEVQEQESDTEVFSANLGKDDKGVQIYDPSAGNDNPEMDASAATDDSTDAAPEDSITDDSNDVEQALGEAEELFAQEDYDGASDKLNEVNAIIDESNSGADKQGDSATTTEEVKVLD
ncbi:MAG: hypothetical protein GWO79_00930, partial [Actinobacteria bacterium]|nr:hypothetical protein [Actinomycetota bacterium]